MTTPKNQNKRGVHLPSKDWSEFASGIGPDTRQPDNHGWRPIETAPKDGTAIDLWLVGKDEPLSEGYCLPNCYWSKLNDCWADEDWRRANAFIGSDPTHWRPLPPPPEDEP